MTSEQWKAFSDFRDDFRAQCERWAAEAGAHGATGNAGSSTGNAGSSTGSTGSSTGSAGEPMPARAALATGWLAALQSGAAEADANPPYPLETPIVYNGALDSIAEADDIRLLVIGDNPGKDEQLAKNRRYLVGQAGKLGAGFFRNNPGLGIDFRKNAIILNKTPIHTAKTKQLAWIRRNGGERFERLFAETQAWMAERTAALAASLGCPVWLVGYGELRETGLFAEYAAALSRTVGKAAGEGTLKRGAKAGQADAPLAPAGHTPGSAREAPIVSPKILLFQHFSMNRFSIDLKERYNPAEGLAENLDRIGSLHRREILGW